MCFCLERFGLSADLEPPRGASSLERISLAEAYEQMWAKVITKDLTDETVLETETLRAKWESNPITRAEHIEKFLKYVLSVLNKDHQEDITSVTDAFEAAAVAEAQENAEAAFEQVAEAHRDKVIEFMVTNGYELPSSSYLQQRIATKAGERS